MNPRDTTGSLLCSGPPDERGWDRSMRDQSVPPITSVNPEGYRYRAIERYQELIQERLDIDPSEFPEVRLKQVALPDPYDGKDDIERFESWLQGYLRWCQLNKLLSYTRATDQLHINFMGTNLKDITQDWFNQEVEQFHRTRKTWTFKDLVCEMYKQFVNEATVQKAAVFVNDLEWKAARMVQQPNEYTFKRRFLNRLPDEIGEEILWVHGVSAEHSSLDEMIEATRKVENAQQHTEACRKEHSCGTNTNARDKNPHSSTATGIKKLEQAEGNMKMFRLFKRAGDYAAGETRQPAL
ncbi:hypothetical protein PAXINDRAFT_153336 [Paxillus involutus ATCC 200175]|nr:hypothetical protein PAXINDRAFT_153336 [Paxillus involutus ATCC 200175]